MGDGGRAVTGRAGTGAGAVAARGGATVGAGVGGQGHRPLQQAAQERRRRVDLRDGQGQLVGHRAQLLQLAQAIRARRGVGLEAVPRRRIERPQDVGHGVAVDAFAPRPVPAPLGPRWWSSPSSRQLTPLLAGPARRTPSASLASKTRSFCIPSRMRVLIVPRGSLQ